MLTEAPNSSYRLFGIFPIISWAQSLNDPATQPKDKQQLLFNKIQAWSMLLYYPLEHCCELPVLSVSKHPRDFADPPRRQPDYLAGKGVFNLSPARIGNIAVWSCRFWAVYVVM